VMQRWKEYKEYKEFKEFKEYKEFKEFKEFKEASLGSHLNYKQKKGVTASRLGNALPLWHS
jgi:hypothetical protein